MTALQPEIMWRYGELFSSIRDYITILLATGTAIVFYNNRKKWNSWFNAVIVISVIFEIITLSIGLHLHKSIIEAINFLENNPSVDLSQIGKLINYQFWLDCVILLFLLISVMLAQSRKI